MGENNIYTEIENTNNSKWIALNIPSLKNIKKNSLSYQSSLNSPYGMNKNGTVTFIK